MAFACLTMLDLPDGLPCNPSLLTTTKKPRLDVQALLSNGYATLDKMRKLLNGDVSQDTINALFTKERVLQIEGNAEIDVVSPYFAAQYTPLTVRYFSVIRNEANPDVQVSAVEEKNFTLQGAYPVTDWLLIGVQAKNYSRKFIRSEFMLVDLGTDAGKDKVKPKNQNGVMFNPSVTLMLPGEWKPRVALMVANIGNVTGDTSAMRDPVDVQAGAGITIPLGWGAFDFDLDYRSLSYSETFDEKFHLGGVFHFGTMYLSAGADYYGFSGGIFYALEQINAGILFSTTQAPWNSNDYYANTVYLQVGWQI